MMFHKPSYLEIQVADFQTFHFIFSKKQYSCTYINYVIWYHNTIASLAYILFSRKRLIPLFEKNNSKVHPNAFKSNHFTSGVSSLLAHMFRLKFLELENPFTISLFRTKKSSFCSAFIESHFDLCINIERPKLTTVCTPYLPDTKLRVMINPDILCNFTKRG